MVSFQSILLQVLTYIDSGHESGGVSNDSRPSWMYTVNGQTYQLAAPLSLSMRSCLNNQLLPDDLSLDSKCIARSYYVWGFSSIMLYIILSLQLAWTLGMFLIWLDANVYSELCRKGRKMRGSFRNALDLAEVVREVLGDELCAYSDDEISRNLNKSRTGVQFYSTSDTDNGVSHIGLSSSTNGQRLRLVDNSLYGGLGRH